MELSRGIYLLILLYGVIFSRAEHNETSGTSTRNAVARESSTCPNNCFKQGVCLNEPHYSPNGKCHCFPGFYGVDCSLRTCPAGYAWVDLPSATDTAHGYYTECSNMGDCNRETGQCVCRPGFGGPACDQMLCPTGGLSKRDFEEDKEIPCSGNGRCIDLAYAQEYKDYVNFFDSTTYASWDAHMIQLAAGPDAAATDPTRPSARCARVKSSTGCQQTEKPAKKITRVVVPSQRTPNLALNACNTPREGVRRTRPPPPSPGARTRAPRARQRVPEPSQIPTGHLRLPNEQRSPVAIAEVGREVRIEPLHERERPVIQREPQHGHVIGVEHAVRESERLPRRHRRRSRHGRLTKHRERGRRPGVELRRRRGHVSPEHVRHEGFAQRARLGIAARGRQLEGAETDERGRNAATTAPASKRPSRRTPPPVSARERHRVVGTPRAPIASEAINSRSEERSTARPSPSRA